MNKNLGGSPEKFTIAEVVSAIVEAKGIVTAAAAKLGSSTKTIYNYAERYEEVNKVLADQRVKFVDTALETLLSNLESENEFVKQRAAEYILNNAINIGKLMQDPYLVFARKAKAAIKGVTNDDVRKATEEFFTRYEEIQERAAQPLHLPPASGNS